MTNKITYNFGISKISQNNNGVITEVMLHPLTPNEINYTVNVGTRTKITEIVNLLNNNNKIVTLPRNSENKYTIGAEVIVKPKSQLTLNESKLYHQYITTRPDNKTKNNLESLPLF